MTSVAHDRASRDWSAIAVVGAVALAVSLAGIGNDFASDDIHLIQLNDRLHGLANWRDILTSSYWPPPWNQELYRPLTSLLFAAQYALGGGAPLVFRITSYLLYAAGSVAVFLLAARVLPRGVALASGVLFAAHPVHVEGVALAVGQSELIVLLLAVTMSILYLDRRRRDALGPRDWGVLGILYVAACLTKEHGLVLPALLAAVELCLLRGPLGLRVRRLSVGYLFLAGLAGAIVLLRMTVLGGAFSGHGIAEALEGLSLGGRGLTLLQIVPQWARLLIWPAHLQSDYSPQDLVASTGFGPLEALGLFLLLGALAAGWLLRKRLPVFSFGLVWMAIALLPVSNVLIPTGILLAERTLFLPSAGFLLAVAAAFAPLWSRSAAQPAWREKAWGTAVAVLVVAGVLRSVERQRIWRNEAFFAVRSVQDAPLSYRTQRAYADVLLELGQRELGLDAYQRAIALAPPGHVWRVRNYLALRFRAMGESEPESEQLRASLVERPDQEDTRGQLVAAYLALGQYSRAAEAADSALARGGNAEVFQRLRVLADSAARAGAPPGSVKIRIMTAPR